MFFKKYLALASLVFLVSCVNQPAQGPSYEIYVSAPERVHFSGKGSAAGIMMMGSMGVMGIAIGVAIDEGIAKDIDKALVEQGFNVKSAIRQEVARRQYIADGQIAVSSIKKITVNEYGFKVISGEKIGPYIQLHIESESEKNTDLWLLEWRMTKADSDDFILLNTAKKDGSQAVGALKLAISQSLSGAGIAVVP